MLIPEVLETDVGDGISTIVGEVSQLDIVRPPSVVHGALSNVQHAVVTRVCGFVESNISVSKLVVYLSNEVLETNVGDSIRSIIGKVSQFDVVGSKSVIGIALSNVEHAVVTRVCCFVKSNISVSKFIVHSSEVLETNVGNSVSSIIGKVSQLDIVGSPSVVSIALSNVKHAVVTRVCGMIKSNVSMTVLVVHSNEVLETKSEVVETDVGDGVSSIIGEVSKLDIVRSPSIVSIALGNVEHPVVTRVCGMIKSDISMPMLFVHLSNKVL